MKTVLMAPCFLDGEDGLGNNRFMRNTRWLEYYDAIAEELGIEGIAMVDNGSAPPLLRTLKHYYKNLYLFECQKLERGPGQYDYPYCWRALYMANRLIHADYDKIVMIDTDYFILTKELAHFIRDTNAGWYSFVEERWGFPESSLHVLNRDAFPLFQDFTAMPWKDRVGVEMERALPFTKVYDQFRVGRFGEMTDANGSLMLQGVTMDAYGQASIKTELEFGRYGR